MTAASGWTVTVGDSPLVATAIHDGSSVRDNLRPYLFLSDAARLREEDPWTGVWTEVAPTRLVVSRSRFEVDLNRPRDRAVYLEPRDSWGLRVWNESLPETFVGDSLGFYDLFYREIERLVSDLVERHGRVVVFDLHSYNHRRRGPYAGVDDPELNPEVNVGTGTMDRHRWAPVVDRFIEDLRSYDHEGRNFDVRENVRFFGGQLAKWLHGRFPHSVCVLAIEFKKFFMDEWTGEAYPEEIDRVRSALASTCAGVLEALSALKPEGADLAGTAEETTEGHGAT